MNLPAAAFAASLAGCVAAPTPPAVAVLASTAAPAPAPSVQRSRPYCAPTPRDDTRLQAAWPVGDRTHFCVADVLEPGRHLEEGEMTRLGPDRCASVGRAGDYRAEPAGRGTAPTMPHDALRKTSRDGTLSFRLTGGEREPKGARGTLWRRSKVLASAPIDYDEHVAFEGWIGQGIVLATWVDEGPGCGLRVFDPQVAWPSMLWSEDAQGLSGCHGDYWSWKPTPDTYVMLATDGWSISFVDEKTLDVQGVSFERQGGEDDPNRLVPWLEGNDLVLVYGAPIAGDVVRMNLTTHAFRGFTPASCEATR